MRADDQQVRVDGGEVAQHGPGDRHVADHGHRRPEAVQTAGITEAQRLHREALDADPERARGHDGGWSAVARGVEQHVGVEQMEGGTRPVGEVGRSHERDGSAGREIDGGDDGAK